MLSYTLFQLKHTQMQINVQEDLDLYRQKKKKKKSNLNSKYMSRISIHHSHTWLLFSLPHVDRLCSKWNYQYHIPNNILLQQCLKFFLFKSSRVPYKHTLGPLRVQDKEPCFKNCKTRDRPCVGGGPIEVQGCVPSATVLERKKESTAA